MQIFVSGRARRTTMIAVAMLLLMLSAAYVVSRPFHAILLDPDALRTTIASYGLAAPLVLILLIAVQVVIAPIPNHVAGLVSGYLFGPVYGTLYTFIGVMTGIAIAVSLARVLGRPFVERVVHAETLDRFDAQVEQYGAPALLVAFITPVFPDDAVCLVAGLTPIRYRTILAVAAFGRLPGIVMLNVVGDGLATRPVIVVPLIAATAVSGVLVYRYRDWIRARIEPIERRLLGGERS